MRRRQGWRGSVLVFVFWLLSPVPALATPLPQILVARGGHAPPDQVVPDYERYPLIARRDLAAGARSPGAGSLRWLTAGGRIMEPGRPASASGIRLFPVAAGIGVVRLRTGLHRLSVLSVWAYDQLGAVGRQRQRLALSRELPPELAYLEADRKRDEEAVRFVVAGPTAALPSVVSLISEGAEGRYADALRDVGLVSSACPGAVRTRASEDGLACGQTVAVRLAVDQVDRNHPSTRERTVVAEVGGKLSVRVSEESELRFRVGAPEALEEGGPGRYGVKLRARILRTFPGGPTSVGASDEEAKRIVFEQIQVSSQLWGQCGVSFGPRDTMDIEVVDPPDISMLTVGCRGGLSAAGGHIDLKIGGRRVFVRTSAGQSPHTVSARLASAIRRSGHIVDHFRNGQIEHDALPSFDLVITDKAGDPVSIEGTEGASFTNDATLGVCHHSLELSDGLDHFNDFNAAAGTPEERLLLRALQDDDSSTIELLVVPSFSGKGRIGESFIYTPGASLQNALILDRGGLRAGARSFTLAHELGHILLDLPGHPDDRGVDAPTSLMDADAADSTIFGPRRLSLEDCKRALRQSGRRAPVPLIYDWPL